MEHFLLVDDPMDTLTSMRVFCLVAELRSFTAAADRSGLSVAMVSKHVMRLEQRLSARLLNRSSRHVSLTEVGALYVEQIRPLIESLEETEAAVSRSAVNPRGTLRLSAPVWMANPVCAAILADFQALYPELRFDIDLSGRHVNLVEEGFDLALRATDALEGGLVARRVAEVPFQLVGAPGHLDRHGRPRSLSDLEGRAFLAYSLYAPDGSITLPTDAGPRTIRLVPMLRSANETLLHHAALSGMGLAFLPGWLIAQDIADGRLERVLPDLTTTRIPLFGVYASRAYLSAKVRSFIDFLVRDPRLR